MPLAIPSVASDGNKGDKQTKSKDLDKSIKGLKNKVKVRVKVSKE